MTVTAAAPRDAFAAVRRVRARDLAVPARHDVPDGRPPLRLAEGPLHGHAAAAHARHRAAARGARGLAGDPPRPGVRPVPRRIGRRRRVGLFPLGILRPPAGDGQGDYVDRYGLLERCVGGAVPFPGTTIDESSGSTGTPYNWIRGRKEREVAHRNIGFFARYAFGTAPLVTINAFSMGAWAPGFNMSLGMMRHGIVKSIGPGHRQDPVDARAISARRYRYLISGYPPFLKHLLDEGERRGFPWADYEIHALVGGEGMTEELRDVLLERFASVYSGYGATDIEIGMAGESPVSASPSAGWPGPGPTSVGPCSAPTRACRWSSSTTRSSTSWRSTRSAR